MSLHLIRMIPDMVGLIRWAGHQGVLPDNDEEIGYALHAAMVASFGEHSPAPFAMVREPGRPPTLLAYSEVPVAYLLDAAKKRQEPDAGRVLGLSRLAAKPMPEKFALGRILEFSVRVRPTVRVDRDGDRRKVREIDAFLAAVERAGGAKRDGGTAVPARSEIYAEWLRIRLQAGGADLKHISMDQFRLASVHRRDRERRFHRVNGPIANFAGQIAVRDPDLFSHMLSRGVGRHRAFGFGMLLLRPA